MKLVEYERCERMLSVDDDGGLVEVRGVFGLSRLVLAADRRTFRFGSQHKRKSFGARGQAENPLRFAR